MTITERQLSTWGKLAEEASDGPWVIAPALHNFDLTVVNPKGDAELGNWLIAGVRWKVNAAFISESRTAVPLLVEEVRRLQGIERAARWLSGAMVEAEALGADFDHIDDEWVELTCALEPSS